MAATSERETKSTDRRNQVMVGELPADFLRAGTTSAHIQENEQIGRILQAQQQAGVRVISNYIGRLSVSIVGARLVKNYGLTKMDPYCRVRVGNTVFETPTDYNGAKNPRWNKTVTTYLPHGVDSLYVEVFDERSLTLDSRIAWAHIRIPEAVLSGGTVDDWFPLSGKQGENLEGSINIVLSLAPPDSQVYNYAYANQLPVVMPMCYPQVVPTPVMPPIVIPHVMVPPPAVVPAGQVPRPAYAPQQHVGPLYTEEDIKQMMDMFPDMEYEVVKSVMEANHGNKNATLNSLLGMSSE